MIALLQDNKSLLKAALTARPNVTAFAYFSSAVNPILYVFAGSSYIRKAGLSFMGKLFDATNSSTFSRSLRGSSSRDDSSARRTLFVNPFKSKNKTKSSSGATEDAAGPETLATVDPLE